MTFEEITNPDGNGSHIIVDLGDGAFKSFPVDETNPEYISFIKSLETE